MPAPKGTRPPAAGRGRKLGEKNKIPGAVKDMVLAALNEVGGIEYLKRQAEKNPVAYMALLGKILPTQVSGVNDGPLEIRWIATGVVRHGDNPDDGAPAGSRVALFDAGRCLP
jgi:hypothetical protein